MTVIYKDVKTLTEIGTVTGQQTKALVMYDTSTGEAAGLDVEVLIGIDSSISAMDASISEITTQVEALDAEKLDIANVYNALDKTVDGFALDARQGKALDGAMVHKTGNESIAGIKTFSSSPVVPTPTTDYQAATKAYADSLVVGLLDYRGGFNASVNAYPSTGGSGTGGAILKGDMWVVSVGGTIDGKVIHAGDSLIANVDTPAQTTAKWNTVQSNLTYVPEDVANKKTEISESDQHYPTNGAVHRYVAAEKVSIIESLTGQIDGGVPSSVYGGCGVVDGGSASTIF